MDEIQKSCAIIAHSIQKIPDADKTEMPEIMVNLLNAKNVLENNFQDIESILAYNMEIAKNQTMKESVNATETEKDR